MQGIRDRVAVMVFTPICQSNLTDCIPSESVKQAVFECPCDVPPFRSLIRVVGMLEKSPIEQLAEDPAILRCTVALPGNLETGLQVLIDRGAQSVMVLATAADKWQPEAIGSILQKCPVPAFGGVFPAVFHGKRLFNEGTVLVGLPFDVHTQVLRGISGDRDDLLDNLQESELVEADIGSLLAFVDSRRSNAEFVVDSLYDIFGETVVVAGGGTGSLTERFVPCIITNAGIETDAALLVGFAGRAIQEFEHGWATLDGPHAITAAEGTILKTINHRPAATVYKEAIERQTNWRFDGEDFRKISSLYPLGIEQRSGPHLVRDPLSEDGDALVCVGEVPDGAVIQILQGTQEGLINAAGQVSQSLVNARLANRPSDPSIMFAWDCASRRKFLLEDFQQELDAISGHILPQDQLVGALTLAEVANTVDGTIRLLNKSLVMMCP